ncbi:hypothetical protein ACLIBH_12155 [Virgibacillus sp. W0430]|uniref:hypothetical protein n=1 Tax=Virgibacillus sp. W0430 TaxID=3391580 RepID=UPI003F44A57A
MEGFIDLITSNFILLFIIISGLISLFKNKSNQQQENKEPSNVPKTYPKEVETKQYKKVEERVQDTIQSLSTEEQREKQLERLKDQVRGMSRRESDQMTTSRNDQAFQSTAVTHKNNQLLTNKDKEADQTSLQKQITGRLNQKGLVESIIMAEVLGPPRSVNPYRPRISNRKTF